MNYTTGRVIDTASSNRGSIVGSYLRRRNSSNCHWQSCGPARQPAAVLVASLRKPPTTDEYTPLAELLTPPVPNSVGLVPPKQQVVPLAICGHRQQPLRQYWWLHYATADHG
jgi:hypothetical protein